MKNPKPLPPLLVLLLSGCLPATVTDIPEIRGRVISTDGKPQRDAEVHITEKSQETREWMLKTDTTGRFRLKESTSWAMPFLPIDAIGPKFELTARSGAQCSEAIPFGGGLYNAHYLGLGNPSPKFDLGDVSVK